MKREIVGWTTTAYYNPRNWFLSISSIELYNEIIFNQPNERISKPFVLNVSLQFSSARAATHTQYIISVSQNSGRDW